jgi:hypothetical protein
MGIHGIAAFQPVTVTAAGQGVLPAMQGKSGDGGEGCEVRSRGEIYRTGSR